MFQPFSAIFREVFDKETQHWLIIYIFWANFFFHETTALVCLNLFYEIPHSHSDTQHSVGLLWTKDRTVADLYLTTQTLTRVDKHALSGTRTRNPNNQAAADPHLRLHGHWN
jgi:hypothetical protein